MSFNSSDKIDWLQGDVQILDVMMLIYYFMHELMNMHVSSECETGSLTPSFLSAIGFRDDITSCPERLDLDRYLDLPQTHWNTTHVFSQRGAAESLKIKKVIFQMVWKYDMIIKLSIAICDD